jgi:2-polyprenyl-3-methyl-5-hydroxy-6-metoxy-1,4-benzoquinol methylase
MADVLANGPARGSAPTNSTKPRDAINQPGQSPESTGGRGAAPLHASNVYATEISLTEENDAHTKVINLVGNNRRVLELGCATGSTTQYFKSHGCTVIGVEIDANAAKEAERFTERMIIGDLDTIDIQAELAGDSFDVIVAADVLEHLRNPAQCLRQCIPLLRNGGEVILSIPNVAHADLRLALLQGRFEYQSWGLLDETHLRFFTRDSLREFIESCGLAAVHWDRVQRDIGQTEIIWNDVDDAVLQSLRDQPDADTYQFIVQTIRADPGSAVHKLAHHLEVAQQELGPLRALAQKVPNLQQELDATKAQIDSQRLELLAEHERALDDLRAEHELHVVTLDEQHRDQLKQLRSAHDRDRDQLAAALDAERVARAAERSRLHSELDATIERLRQGVTDDRTALERRLGEMEQASLDQRSEAARLRHDVGRLNVERERLGEALRRALDERDGFREAFESLSGVQDQLVATQRSESFRIGNAIVRPVSTVRRVVRAWQRVG